MVSTRGSLKPITYRPAKLAAALIDPYVVMQGEEFQNQEPPQTVQFDVVQAMDETDVIGDAGDFEARYVVSRFRLLFGFKLGVE